MRRDHEVRVDVDEHLHLRGECRRAVPVDDVGDRVGDHDVLARVVAGQRAPGAQEAVDDGLELLAGAQDHRAVAQQRRRDGTVGCPGRVVEEHLGVARDRREGRTQLVPDGAEELLVALLRLGAGVDRLGERAPGLLEREATR